MSRGQQEPTVHGRAWIAPTSTVGTPRCANAAPCAVRLGPSLTEAAAEFVAFTSEELLAALPTIGDLDEYNRNP